MNPYYLLIPAMLISCLYGAAQDSLAGRNAPGLRYQRVAFELSPATEKKNPAFPVSSIEVVDVRQDTTKFGYYGSGKTVSPYRQFCFQHGSSADITYFLNNSFNLSPRGIRLLYCLKKLWITNTDTTANDRFAAFDYGICVYVKAELFLEKDNRCYPLYRFDSIFEYQRPLSSFCIKWVEDALPVSLNRLKGLDTVKVLKRNSLSRAEIEAYYADEKHVPIASVAHPAKGVYLNAEQFKNNRPAYADYEVDYDRMADITRVKEPDGSITILKNDWGFCDGQQFYIRIGRSHYRLYKTGNTWEVNGSPVVTRDMITVFSPWHRNNCRTCGTPSTAPNAPVEDPVVRMKPQQLDIETGKVY